MDQLVPGLSFMKNSKFVCKTKSIGSIASEILSKDQDGHVLGVTSKGIYIKTSQKWLVYLSFDPFRGPLTITLGEVNSNLHLVSTGHHVRIESQSIIFPNIDILISTKDSEVWQPNPPLTLLIDDPQRHQRLVSFAKEVMAKKGAVGLGIFLSPLLGLTNTHPAPGLKSNLGWTDMVRLQSYVQKKEITALAGLLSKFMGSGLGLTPSADDFIIGLLLSLNRWQNLLWTSNNLLDLNLQVVETAYQRTTSLSANLIECASLGQADERLINALDWMVTGLACEPEIVDRFLEWGNSSGVDAFVGMVVASLVNK
jgi:hypothetical protein